MVTAFMNKPVGGRGKKAPYQTTHYRIPEPIKELVESLASQYRDYVFEGDTVTFDNKNLLPRVPAIYFVLEDDEVVYIGQTQSLLDRWRSHHVTARLGDLSGNISIAWLECGEVKLLPALEKILIDTLDPKFNLPKGGYFPHAERWGRRSNWKNGATKTIRVPEHLADQVLEAAHKLDDAIAEKSKLQLELEQVQQELAICKASQSQQPDLEAIRDRVLAGLKLGKQAPGYKSAKKVLDDFISRLKA